MKQAIHLTVEEEAAISQFFSANGGSIKFMRNMDTEITVQPIHMGKYIKIHREREDAWHGYYGQFYLTIDGTGFDGAAQTLLELRKETDYAVLFLQKLTEITPKKIVR